MVVWNPPRETTRIRNAVVVSLSGGNATIRLDGTRDISNVPVYGTVSAGQGVLVLEQGGSLLVLGLEFLPLTGGKVTGSLESATAVYAPAIHARTELAAPLAYLARVLVSGAGIEYTGATVGGGDSNRIGFRWSSPNIVATVDNVVAAVAAVVSTGRIKGDVRAVGGAVEQVRALNPVTYSPLELDGTVRADAGRHIGLVAEEVAETLPSAVLRNPDTDEPLSVNYLEIVPLLVKAVQEQQAQIDALAARVAALEAGGSDG